MEYDDDDILVFQDIKEDKEEKEKELIKYILMDDYNIDQQLAEDAINQAYKYHIFPMPEAIIWIIGATSYLSEYNLKLTSPINRAMFECKKQELKKTKIVYNFSREYLNYIEQLSTKFIKKDKNTIKNLYYQGMIDMFYIKNINYITYPESTYFEYLKHMFMEDFSFEYADMFDLLENIITNEYADEFMDVDLFDLMIKNVEYINSDLDPYIKVGRLFLINYIDENNLEFEENIEEIVLEDETISDALKNKKNLVLTSRIKEKNLSNLRVNYYLS